MKSLSITGTLREESGTTNARRVRREGKVPCVLYGGTSQVHFVAHQRDFKKLIFTPEVHQVKLTLGDKEFNAFLKEVQYHPVTDAVIHADFLELMEDKAVAIQVPVRVSGSAPGVLAGGKLQQKLRKIKVKALPSKLPEAIEINISEMEIGDSIKAGSVTFDGVEVLDSPNAVIVAVRTSRVAVSPAEGAEGAAAAEAKPAEGKEEAKEAKGEQTEAKAG